jgi:hypothetical protein
MKRAKLLVLTAIFFVGFSLHIYADVIDTLSKNQSDMLVLMDQDIEKAIERAKTDYAFATWLYFMGGDEYWYVGSIYAEEDTLELLYSPPGLDTISEDGSSIMAYSIDQDRVELILKKWTWNYTDEDSEKKEKEIVYYRVVLTEDNGKINYTCAYTTPALDLHDYTINTGIVIDDNVYAYSLPAFHAQKITELKKGTVINILPTRLSENGPEEEPYDFWYKIEINKTEAWVYGYSINFSNKIKVK